MTKNNPQELINILGSISKYKFLCIDSDGETWLSSHKPKHNNVDGWLPAETEDENLFDMLPEGFKVEWSGDWKETCFEYKDKKAITILEWWERSKSFELAADSQTSYAQYLLDNYKQGKLVENITFNEVTELYNFLFPNGIYHWKNF